MDGVTQNLLSREFRLAKPHVEIVEVVVQLSLALPEVLWESLLSVDQNVLVRGLYHTLRIHDFLR